LSFALKALGKTLGNQGSELIARAILLRLPSPERKGLTGSCFARIVER